MRYSTLSSAVIVAFGLGACAGPQGPAGVQGPTGQTGRTNPDTVIVTQPRPATRTVDTVVVSPAPTTKTTTYYRY